MKVPTADLHFLQVAWVLFSAPRGSALGPSAECGLSAALHRRRGLSEFMLTITSRRLDAKGV